LNPEDYIEFSIIFQELDGYYKISDEENLWIQSFSPAISKSYKEDGGYICFSKSIGKNIASDIDENADDAIVEFNNSQKESGINVQNTLNELL
jgi:hypothetical protein